MRALRIAIITAALARCAVPVLGVSYEVTDLGSLVEPFDINNNGQVVGCLDGHATIWQNGNLTDLGALSQWWSYPGGMSSNGTVAGYSYVDQTDPWGNAYQHAFLWAQGGPMQDLGTLGGDNSRAVDVNDSGWSIGWSQTGVGADAHYFLYQPGIGMADLGADFAVAGINNSGQIVGNKNNRAVIWQNGVFTDIGGFYALDINDLGEVLGEIEGLAGQHAALWRNGQLTDLGILGGKTSDATGFNTKGQVVGMSAFEPFIWQDGVMTGINSLLPSGSGWSLFSADAINDSGQIVGGAYFGNPLDSDYHGLLLTPIPEPSALAALGFGLLPLGGFALRRRRRI